MAGEPRWAAGNHPTPEQLLLAREAELPREEAEPILGHIHQCWQCRALVERHKRGIDAYLKFRETHSEAPRPGGWLRLSARLREAGNRQAAGETSVWKRVPRSAWLALSTIAAAVAIAVVVIAPARLSATVVLDRAVRAEAVPGRGFTQRVRVRRHGRTVPTEDAVLRLAHIDPTQPLSAAAFRAWHDSLRSGQDSVTTAADEIRIETRAADGEIALAWLAVARTTYQPHAEHVELRDGDTVDVETVETPSAPAAEVTAARAAPNIREAAPGPAPDPRETIEIETRWALHRIEADLGEPLEIHPTADGVLVSGTLDDGARLDQIAGALRELLHVSTHLEVAATDAGLISQAQPLESRNSAAGPLLAPKLAADWPAPDARRTFVSDALHLSQSVLRHSWALRRLADRYPLSAESQLPAEVRASLQSLVAAHQDSIRSAARDAAVLWKPYVPLEARVTSPRTTWQNASFENLRSAQGFDHLTTRLVAAGGDDGWTVSEALRQLREKYRQFAVPENP